ncbi:uncharacterized protein KD926_008079 [Aspergillus affinis]|uniref:uncharacterized protein n=1 Tax=Aspergillus affinis TaxID=1070780 RepID=UPI0022FF377A|nr:uncharacterized protein KD926_008079 [Aspergillus affinis]KAI9045662.1 hypothetical protein KD926_008079 [Aspergillus affinis]
MSSEPEVGGSYGRDFPRGSLLHQKVGHELEWGFFKYLFTGILWEKPDNGYGERQGLMKARDILLGKNVFVNVRILCSKNCDLEDEKVVAMIDRANEAFDYEVNTFHQLYDTGRTPVVITSTRILQDNGWENPGGYLHIYVMEEYPLLGLDDAFDVMSEANIPMLENELYSCFGIFFRHRLAYYAADYEYKYDAARKILFAVNIENFHSVRDLDDLEAAESYFSGVIRNLQRTIEIKSARALEARSRALASHSMFEGTVEHWEDINDEHPLTEFNTRS